MNKNIVIFCLILFFSISILAQSPLQGSMVVSKIAKVKGADGKEKLLRYKDVETARPGETLEYLITYINISKQQLQNIQIIGPIPNTTYFLKNSLQTKNTTEFQVSIDNGLTFVKPPAKKKVEIDKKVTLVEVTEKEWTHIQCLVPKLDPAETAVVQYWVVVK